AAPEIAEHLLHFRRQYLQGLACPVLAFGADPVGLAKEPAAGTALNQHQAAPVLFEDRRMAYMKIVCKFRSEYLVVEFTSDARKCDLKIPGQIEGRAPVPLPAVACVPLLQPAVEDEKIAGLQIP